MKLAKGLLGFRVRGRVIDRVCGWLALRLFTRPWFSTLIIQKPVRPGEREREGGGIGRRASLRS